MPAAKRVVAQRLSIPRVDIDHHLGDALFTGLHRRAVDCQPELAPQG